MYPANLIYYWEIIGKVLLQNCYDIEKHDITEQ